MEKYKIEIGLDGDEAMEFVEWLRVQGHDACLGQSTGSYVDGEWTSHDEEAGEILRDLWNQYCDEA